MPGTMLQEHPGAAFFGLLLPKGVNLEGCWKSVPGGLCQWAPSAACGPTGASGWEDLDLDGRSRFEGWVA